MCLSLPFIAHSHQLLVLATLLSVSVDLLFWTVHICKIRQGVATCVRLLSRCLMLSGFTPVVAWMVHHRFGSWVWATARPMGAARFSPHSSRSLSSGPAASWPVFPGPSFLGRRRNSSHCEHAAAERSMDTRPEGHFCGLWKSRGYAHRPQSPEPGLSPQPGAGCPPTTGLVPPWDPEQRCPLHLSTGLGPLCAHLPHVRVRGGHVCPRQRMDGARKAASCQAPPAPGSGSLAHAAFRGQLGLQTPAVGLSKPVSPAAWKAGPGLALHRSVQEFPRLPFCQAGHLSSHRKARCPARSSMPGATGQALPEATDGGSEASRQGAAKTNSRSWRAGCQGQAKAPASSARESPALLASAPQPAAECGSEAAALEASTETVYQAWTLMSEAQAISKSPRPLSLALSLSEKGYKPNV